MKPKYNYAKLKGRLAELDLSYAKFEKLLGISDPTFRKKIQGESYFTQDEIERSMKILKLPLEEINIYFFNRDEVINAETNIENIN